MNPDFVHAFVKAIEVKDHSTAAHTWRVVLYTRAIAEEAGFDHPMTARLSTAAALHDLGKLDIPDSILQKPGRLTEDEYSLIKTHTIRGHQRLTAMDEQDPFLLDLVRSHHERWDGKGYPDRLAGDAIPVAARYFAVIDSFDAMTSLRPYRTRISQRDEQRAMDELRSGSGTRYWPQAVQIFAGLHGSGRLRWITRYFNDAATNQPSSEGPRPSAEEPGPRSGATALRGPVKRNGHRP